MPFKHIQVNSWNSGIPTPS